MSDEGDSVARYQRPPRKGQFKSGQSGNPRGRPKWLEEYQDLRSSAAEGADRGDQERQNPPRRRASCSRPISSSWLPVSEIVAKARSDR